MLRITHNAMSDTMSFTRGQRRPPAPEPRTNPTRTLNPEDEEDYIAARKVKEIVGPRL